MYSTYTLYLSKRYCSVEASGYVSEKINVGFLSLLRHYANEVADKKLKELLQSMNETFYSNVLLTTVRLQGKVYKVLRVLTQVFCVTVRWC